MLPFLFGIMVPILLASLAIVGWALATSEPAPDYADADLLSPSPESTETSVDTETDIEKPKSDPASVEKPRKVS